MAKGYGADSTLVAAAYRLGQSYGPADYSQQFKTMYDGLAESFKARANMFNTMMKSTEDAFGDVMETSKEAKEERKKQTAELFDGISFDKQLDEIATSECDNVVKDQKDSYDTDRLNIPNKAIFDYEKNIFTEYKDEIEKLDNKLFLTKKEKQRRFDVAHAVGAQRKKMNKLRATTAAVVDGWSNGLYDMELSHEGSSDNMFLLSQVLKKDGNLNDINVKVFKDKDGDMALRYSPGVGAEIYKNRFGTYPGLPPTIDKPTLETPDLKENLTLTSKKTNVLDVPEIKSPDLPELNFKERQYKTVKVDDLFKGLVSVDNESRNLLEAETAIVTAAAEETLKNNKNAVAIDDFSKIEKKTEKNISKVLQNSSSYRNLTNKPILIAGEEISWKDDLNSDENITIDAAIVSQMGIGSDILTLDEIVNWDGADGSVKDGVIDQDELNEHKEAKAVLIDKLLNPKNVWEKQASISEYSKYITNHLGQAFDQTRDKMDIESSKKGLNTRLVKAIESGQKNITIGRERFELQGGKYKLVQVLPQGSPTWVDFGEDVSYSVDEFIQDYGKRFKAK